MRDWKKIDNYYLELLGDIYEQPADEGHTAWATDIIDKWIPMIKPLKTILDVGCGVGFCQPIIEKHGVKYTGIAIGKDVMDAQKMGYNVSEMDFNFLEYPDKSFDLIFSRHSLEHSPFPLLSLMEWNRVARNWLILVLPTPRSFRWGGRNHYGIMSASQARFLLERAGWARLWEDHIEEEFRFFCSKVDRVATLDDIKDEYEVEEEE